MGLCAVCGERPAEVKARIDSSALQVCLNCASLGSVIGELKSPVILTKKFVPAPDIEEPEEILIGDYGFKIKKAREAANLTQEEFALKLNISLAVLKPAESGKRLDIQTAKRIEKALGINLVE